MKSQKSTLSNSLERDRPRVIWSILPTTMEAHPQQFEDRPQWSVEDSAALYMIDRWGSGYFGVNTSGDLTVSPLQENGVAIPIVGALREAKALSLDTPLLIRFQDLLRHRVEGLNKAFAKAIADH